MSVNTPSPLTDQELVKMYADGDRSAFVSIYERHAPGLRNVAAAVVGIDNAEDIVHDSFLVLQERPKSFADADKPASLLYTVALNLSRNHVRRQKRQKSEDGFDLLESSSESPSHTARQMELKTEIENMLAKLPAADRNTISLVFFSEKPRHEVCEEMGMPEGTLKSRLSRALGSLQTIWKKERQK